MSYEDRKEELRKQIAELQAELSDMERYRYRTMIDSKGQKIELRDDGYRIHFRLPDTISSNVDPGEWILWADYKQCELPGPGSEIAGALMMAPMPHSS